MNPSAVQKLVNIQYVRSNGIGQRRMYHMLKDDICASQRFIGKVLSENEILTAKCNTKTPYRYIPIESRLHDKLS